MGEFEVDGEEKLIVAAEYLVQELRSNKSLTRNAKKVLGSLLSELSRVVIVSDEIEQRLNLVCEKITAREVDETMIWDLGSDAGNEFLEAVNELRGLIDRVDGTTEEEVSLRKAHDVLQTAMARLEDEFKHLLVENRLPFELEHAVEEDSFGTEDLILGRNSEDHIVVDLVRPEVISDLKSIAEAMIASGYDRECIQVCTTVRKEALDEFLYDHEVEKLSIEDVLKMDWAKLLYLNTSKSSGHHCLVPSSKNYPSASRIIKKKIFEPKSHPSPTEFCHSIIKSEAELFNRTTSLELKKEYQCIFEPMQPIM